MLYGAKSSQIYLSHADKTRAKHRVEDRVHGAADSSLNFHTYSTLFAWLLLYTSLSPLSPFMPLCAPAAIVHRYYPF